MRFCPRFASLWNGYVGLSSALEEARPLLLVGAGGRGIAPLRAALEWTPVQVRKLSFQPLLPRGIQTTIKACSLIMCAEVLRSRRVA